eukprot:TRINITY_DN4210_c0_g2_i1.p1 TRINITY_DN4210_c0_g2~~TRINITY_DN4210_c0_g2_i1.p1  ORF type:complete len:445 (-),score=136.28 TRINITY_DN4210_c0_g2_i1:903-2237(-)
MTAVRDNTNMGKSYTFASEPRAVVSRRKYRDPNATNTSTMSMSANLMFDRRVVRGNTYAQPIPPPPQPDPVRIQKEAETRRLRQEAKKRAADERPITPEAVDGRTHIQVQTEVYLEEITDRVVEVDIDTQTDPFLDRPPSPLFIPRKSGIDAETQILEGELFDFDLEVEPILQVLVGRSLEQALVEVIEEEEVANMRAHQIEYERIRNAELAEIQRMEAAEKRKAEEKERRLAQEQARKERELQKKRRAAARTFAEQYLSDLQSNVFTKLEEDGFFFNPVQKEVETGFIPWLFDRVADRLGRVEVARRLTDTIIETALNRHLAANKQANDRLKAQWEQEKAEELRLQKEAEERIQIEELEGVMLEQEEKYQRDVAEAIIREAKRIEEEEKEAARLAAEEEAARIAAEEEAARLAAEEEANKAAQQAGNDDADGNEGNGGSGDAE